MNKLLPRRTWLALVGTMLLVLGMTAPQLAHAEEPVTLTDRVTDPSSFLSAGETKTARDALNTAATDGYPIYAAVVGSFDGDSASNWCLAAANQSGISGDSIVLVVAYEDRQAGWCISDDSPHSDNAIEAAYQKALGVLGAADPLTGAATAQAIETFAQSVPTQASGESNTGAIIFFILILVAALTFLFFAARSARKKTKLRDPRNPAGQKERITESGQQLLYADEALRAASEELEFARAQYGTLRTDALSDAIGAAKARLPEAFTLLNQMDSVSDLTQKAAFADQILALINQIMPPVAKNLDELKHQQAREANLDQLIAQSRQRVNEAQGRLPAMTQELTALQQLYPPEMLTSLVNLPGSAATALEAADGALTKAQALAKTQRSEAVGQVDFANRQLGQALTQMDTLADASGAIERSSQLVGTAIASLSASLDDVARLATDRSSFQSLVSDAQNAITNGETARAGKSDPLAALQQLRQAEDALNQALDPLRAADDVRTRQESQAKERIAAAETLVSQAESYVQASRNWASLDQRSQVRNARELLQRAKNSVGTDPATAISLASQAEAQARASLSGGPGTGRGPGRGANFSDALLWGAILGGWGNNSRRGGGGFGGGGFSGGRGGGGGFGGGGFSGGRGGGGGFGGGGFSGGRGGSSGF